MSSNNYQYISGSKFYKGSTSVDSGFQEPIDTVGSPDAAMEINSYPSISRKGADMVDQHLQQQLASLKHQQQMQQQILLQQYQQQRQQLEQEHEKQLQEHIKYLQHRRRLQQEHEKQLQEHIQGYLEQQQQQKKLEQQRMEKEMMEKERLNQIKNKGKDEESAIASSEVKLKLQEFVLTKKHREAAAKDMTNSPPQFRHPWVPNSSSLDQSSPPLSNLSPPYPHPLLGKYDDDFPLRKTASEPNIYKVRSALKQKLETRRTMIAHSPLMVRRRDKGPLQLKRKTPMSIETGVCGSNPDSGPNSPSSSAHGSLANGSLSSLHSKEDSAAYMFSPFRPGMYPGTDLSLYTSPSMPNISLGRPPVSGPSSASTSSSVVSEEELRTALSARMGLPLAAHLLPGAAPCFFPPLPMIDSDFPAGSAQAAAYLAAQSKLVNPYTIPGSTTTTSPLVEPPTHPAHRLHRHHRPLGRTHSAPLPLGHPGFTQTTTPQQQQQQQQTLLLQQQHEQYLKENQKLYLKQHIRQTVLQRAGSKGHMENVDEETEVKLAQEMKESPEAETEESKEENTVTKEPVAVAVAEEMKEAENKMEEGALAPSELEKQQREREAFLSQQRDIIKGRHGRHTHHRPLSRTQSSPLVTFSVPPQQPADTGPVTYNFTTGLAYDTIMLKHQCSCNNNDNHLEHAGRIQSIWQRLTESGLVARCERLRTRKATLEELQSCHTDLYAEIFGGNPYNRQRLMENFPMRFCILPCGGIGVDSDTVWNDMHTSSASRMAAGSVVELACQVAAGNLKNGVAIVRPPGHHAEKDQAMGFCYFNSIAIAAKQLREKKLNKILIVDWDVHHGNGTQQMFYEDPHVLYISIHRHDNGNFFPGTGAPTECGADSGQGFNVNIAFGGGLNPPMGDAEYLTAFRTIVMPIAREFNPECVLVSAGFDAAKGHPTALGGYEVSPACFGHMTRELMSLAGGKVVLTLEGGYDIDSICEATEACVRALLGDELLPIAEEELTRPICRPALDTLETAIRIQYRHWPCVKRYQGTINQTLMEAQKLESVEADTVTALASLSMVTAKRSGSAEQESEPMEEGS